MTCLYRDPYQILGIKSDASRNQIKKSYRSLAMQYHPDQNPDDLEAAEKFKQIQWAYEKLTRHNKRDTISAEEIRKRQNDLYFSDDVHPIIYFFEAMRRHANYQKKEINDNF